MKLAIHIVSLGLLLAACGDDGAGPADAAIVIDAVDAPVVEYECPKSGTTPVCGAATAPTVPITATGGSVCNPLTQTGCNAGEKCTWIVDQASPPIGHIGCSPEGTIQIGCACTVGTPGATGYDSCVKGSTCITGQCKQICDTDGGAPSCATGFACTGYADVFESGGTRVAGLCDVTCDPLTQCTSVSQTPNACGATNSAMPNRGCYGLAGFSCSAAPATTLTLTDRMPPRTSASGAAFLNGCAPGFVPFFYSMTGSTQVLCTGLCAALEIDNTPAHAGNTWGDATAPAKLPLKDRPYTGDGTCEIGKKGSEASSTCKYIWPYMLTDTGDLQPKFVATGLLDTLGVCFATAHFMYDSNADGTPDAPQPACNTLPPKSASTTGTFDDAADWGCQKMANSGRVAPALGDIHIGLRESVPLVRHAMN